MAQRSRGQGGGRKPPPMSAKRRQELRRRNLTLGVVGVAVVVLIGVLVFQRSQDKAAQDEAVARITAGDCRYDTRTDPGSEHVENLPPYEVNPPSGGDHTPQAAAAGIYSEAQVPPDGPVVHAMEHGFIIVWYKPGDTDAHDGAVSLGDELSQETLVVPRPSLPVPVAATAWHRRLLCDSFERDALATFVQEFRDQGPEKGFL